MAYPIFLMDMNGTCADESFFPQDAQVLDLSQLSGTSCYCDPEAASVIKEKISGLPARSIRWIDGGDYHYLSYFWMLKIIDPFTLVLIDNHPDDQECAFGGDLLSCGSWVAAARRDVRALRDVIWIRSKADLIKIRDMDKMCRNFYVSLDKDALSADEYRTNWDQSDLSLSDVRDILDDLSRIGRILCIDVCGGISKAQGATEEDLEINRKADYELRNYFVSLQDKY